MMIRKPSGGQKSPPIPSRRADDKIGSTASFVSPRILPWNYPTCQSPIGTPDGGPILWAVDDALATLRDELAREGLPCPWPAVERARAVMMGATYMRRAMEVA